MGGGTRLYRTERTSRSGGTDFAKNAQVDKTEYTPVEVDYVRSYLLCPKWNRKPYDKPPN